MQDKRGLDPQAKEFIPRSCDALRGAQHIDSRHTTTALSCHAKNCSYRSALEGAPSSSPHCLSKTTPEVQRARIDISSKPVLDMENLLMSRRLSKPKMSALASHKERWMEIAHRQAASLKNVTPLVAAPSLEGASSLWHSVLSQSDTISPPSTSALVQAEELQSQLQRAKVAETVTQNGERQHSTYDAWWHAVLQADFATMVELIDQHRISWDSTFVNSLCSESLCQGMTTFCKSIAILNSQSNISEQSMEGLNALHVCSLHPRYA